MVRCQVVCGGRCRGGPAAGEVVGRRWSSTTPNDTARRDISELSGLGNPGNPATLDRQGEKPQFDCAR